MSIELLEDRAPFEPWAVDGVDPEVEAARDIVASMREADQAMRIAAARRFMLAADYADYYGAEWFGREYPDGGPSGPLLPWTEKLDRPAGDGTPVVAEFCGLELAAALRISVDSAELMIRDALALRHRLPRCWDLLDVGMMGVWEARDLVAAVVDLTAEQCAKVDRVIAPQVGHTAWTRLLELAEAMVLEARGEDEIATEETIALAGRGVWFDTRHDSNLVRSMSAVLDTADAIHLDGQINRMATILRHGTDTDASRDVLRAKAMSVLASPARALQLLQASILDELPELELDAECPAVGQRGHTCGTIDVDPDKLLPQSEIVVHVTDTTLIEQSGLVRVEKVGPLLAGWVKDLIGHTRVRVRPVIAPDELRPTDSYEVPERMREWVQIRNPYEAFPYSKRASRRLDLDHTIPWTRTNRSGSAPGTGKAEWPDTSRLADWFTPRDFADPPGPPSSGRHGVDDVDRPALASPATHPESPPDLPPTRPDNLGPLRRKVHRAKTHARWKVTQPRPGVYLWESPLGFGYLVTPSASWMIHDPTGRIIPRQPPALEPPPS